MVKYFIGGKEYAPGFYDKDRPAPEKLADAYLSGLDGSAARKKRAFDSVSIPPCICLSRRIGVGALEIADLVSRKAGLPVVDRQMLEHIAKTRELSAGRDPGEGQERLKGSLAAIFGEKSFMDSDFARKLFDTVFSVAGTGSTIFVGRGTHLVLPRERVLAVRIVASRAFRTKRLAETLGVAEEEAGKKLVEIDAEQHEYYKSVFGITMADADEFDLTINRDYLRKPESAAAIIATAFREKFDGQVRPPAPA